MKLMTLRKKRIGIFAIITALMLSTIFIQAQAYTLHGRRLEKKLVFVPYKSFGSTTISHFNEAFWEWNKECDIYQLKRTTTTHSDTDYYTSASPTNKIYKVFNSSDNAPASAMIKCNISSPYDKVESASININPYRPLSNGAAANTYDVWTIFIHEAGHILGFNHSSLYYSVMNVYPAGTINRYLSSSDIDGINYLYK